MTSGLDKIPWYGQIAVCLGVVIALQVVFHLYYAAPRSEMQRQGRAELDTARAAVAQARRDATDTAAFQVEVDELRRRLDALSASLPEREEVSELLRRLQTFAAQSNLTIRAFRPQPAVTRDTHSEWPYRLQLDGTYHNLGLFLERISRFSRIINVSDVVIRAKEQPEPDLTITVECTATTFVLLDTPESAPGAKPVPADLTDNRI